VSSGLIAGESIAGIVIAGMIYAKFEPKTIIQSNPLSLLIFVGFIVYLFLIDRITQ